MKILSLLSLVAVVSSPPGLGHALQPSQHVSSLARQDRNNGMHLAVSPVCSPLSGRTADVNAGAHCFKIEIRVVAVSNLARARI